MKQLFVTRSYYHTEKVGGRIFIINVFKKLKYKINKETT